MSAVGPGAASIALVTGAGTRVGKAIALALGARGWAVAVHHHASGDGARDTARRLEAAGAEAHLVRADLADPATLPPLVAAVVERFGGLDLLVNSAANWVRVPFGEATASHVDASVATNLRAPLLLAQAAAPALAARRGAIVNIADHLAYDWAAPSLVHGIVKGGVEAMTRGLASVLAPDVRVNAVAPGVVLLPDDTPPDVAARLAAETPLARNGVAEDVAEAVCFLATAGYVTGEILHVDGGRHLRR